MESPAVRKRLKIALSLVILVMGLEVAGGIYAHSLALLSDAAHMLTDSFALSLSLMALTIAAQPSDHTKTFGYHRLEILAALANGLLLLLMAIGILWEAYRRFTSPQEVHTEVVIGVAAAGLLTNLAVLYFLKDPVHNSHQHDLNLKGAFYHVIGDSLASLAVIIGGIGMWFTQWYALDSIIAAGVALILIWGAQSIIRDSFHILLEGVPKGISLQEVEKELTSIPEVKDIHELHVWSICSNIYALSTHALVTDQKVNQMESVLQKIENLLREKFNITHSTVQFESTPCPVADLACNMKH
ncbi:MAG: cation diffusion facilitator family transporter [Nitrospinaceae bacterium]|nr:cation transporter [Nitrospinaceae bacterium]NIR56981.1 cation transporter [Nitrospinaceae bacterium]NIS87438.1 cation transporter [Nitrospinaceae bacterium]NIT84287.1 cation transporter [Nitrospinaceae bacterium]NIU46477.1 cation transporter [Nitrospinaceae bacterium]